MMESDAQLHGRSHNVDGRRTSLAPLVYAKAPVYQNRDTLTQCSDGLEALMSWKKSDSP